MADEMDLTAKIQFIIDGLDGVISQLGDVEDKFTDLNGATEGSQSGLLNMQDSLRGVQEELQTTGNTSDQVTQKFGKGQQNAYQLQNEFYNVSYAARAVGTAMIGAAAGVEGAAASYEQSFASVSRTLKTVDGTNASQQLADVREQLVDLSNQIPVSFDQISQIATLGNQLNINPGQLTAFTQTVAEFSATTGVDINDASTDFGRLSEILHDSDFQGIGDQIAYLGANSAATESQVAQMALQLGVTTTAQGFTTQQTLALSTALASLGISAESGRSAVQRTFLDINAAVAEGGQSLDQFAQASGMSASQFQQSWSSDSSSTFVKFVQGIGTYGSDAASALDALGITSVRDQQTLTSLAHNSSQLTTALQEAGDASGYLEKAYEKQTQTVSAQMTILGNIVKSIGDEIGQTTSGPVVDFIKFLQGMAEAVKNIESNPFTAWSTAVALGLSALVGVGLIALSTFLQFASVMVNIQRADSASGGSSNILSAAFKVLTGSVQQNTQALTENVAATQKSATSDEELAASKQGVTEATGAETAEIVAETEAKEGSSVANASLAASTAETAAAQESAAGSAGLLTGALGKAGLIGAALALVAAAPGVLSAIGSWVQGLEGVKQTADQVTQSLTELNSTQKSVSNSASNSLSKSLTYANKNLSSTIGPLAGGNGLTGGQALYNNDFNAGQQNGQSLNFVDGGLEANSYAKQAQQEITPWDQALVKASGDTKTFNADLAAYHKAMDDSKLSTTQQDQLLTQLGETLGITSGNMSDTSLQAAALAQSQKDAGDSSTNLAQTMQQNADAYFATSEGIQQAASDVNALGAEFYTAGANAAIGSQPMQQALDDIITTAGSGPAAAQQMGYLFEALIQGGYASAAQLEPLIAEMEAVTGSTISVTGASQKAADVLPELSSGYNSAAASAQKAADSTENAAKQVYTLVDYGNDLNSVFQRIDQLDFGNQDAMDAVTSGWQKISDASKQAKQDIASAKDEISQANQKMEEANATISQLASNRSEDEYWLSVANQYGDTARASSIQADLAQNTSDTKSAQNDKSSAQSDLAKGNSDLSDAIDESSMSLEGNSKQAIANRAQLEGMVTDYQSLIQSYAESGATQQQVAQYAQQLKTQFEQQATQAGYSKSQLDKYTDSFDSITEAIQKVPRKVTVDADADPAITALNEFLAKAASSTATPKIADPNAGDQGRLDALTYTDAWNKEAGANRGFIKSAANVPGGTVYYMTNSSGGKIGNGFFADGGYTGAGGKYEPAGIVHAGEYVFPQEAVKYYGVQNLAALQHQATGYAQGGPVGSPGISVSALGSASNKGPVMVELSPYDRQLLMEVRDNAGVSLNPQGLALASSAVNVNSASRGRA